MASIRGLISNIKLSKYVQRLPRIHSHIRGLFWTSKRFLLASTSCRPPLIMQLPVCTVTLVNAFCLGLYNRNPVSVTPLQCHHVEEAHTAAMVNEAESGKSCRQLADQFNIGRAQAIIKRKAELLLEYDQNIYMQH